MTIIIVIILLPRKGDFLQLFTSASQSSALLCMVLETFLVPGEFLIGKGLDTGHNLLAGHL